MLCLVELVAKAKVAIKNAKNITVLDAIRVEFLGKKGYLSLQMISLRNLPIKERPIAGTIINQAKQKIQEMLNIRKEILRSKMLDTRLVVETIDVSLPGRRMENGGLHCISQTIDYIETFFNKLGFSVVTGPEIENNYYNFDALNISAHHPAYADHDTFWFDSTRLLRTQTSGVQIRVMQRQPPPIRIIVPGRVYRNDYNSTHTPMFHQMEGLMVDHNISFANLKGIIHNFLKNFFEEDLQIRFRPSYFPFTEPSAEADIMGKNGQWLEVLGCGMVHPNVLRNVGINERSYSAFAFGIGIERLAMLRYGVNDLRAFFKNDWRFLKQFN
ncbi:phenylalanine--tRNA ligase subunit alpha [Candidatus Fukatsuia anoeciicola]|uniref:phenylalanine--tRNA ligase subunit alpha n=1 Tax=Candidatus Fukatsuia anoeciicola TaxID=2994492 RepID=UPI003463C8BE